VFPLNETRRGNGGRRDNQFLADTELGFDKMESSNGLLSVPVGGALSGHQDPWPTKSVKSTA
ncbi:uncharacterized protein METZ01_LOCUS233436, partial [marine metagenome]